MNNQRRKQIDALISELNKITETLGNLMSTREELAEDEQEYFDNMPDSIRDGEKGQAAEESLANFEEAEMALDTVAASLDEAIRALEGAKDA